MKKKVIFCANTLCLGGIEKSLINLLNQLDNNKYEIHLMLESKEGELLEYVPKNIKIIEYKVYNLKNKLIQKLLNYFNQLKWKILYKNKYDCSILYATYSYAANFCARQCSKNKIMYIHSDYTNIYEKEELKKFFNTRRIKEFKNLIFVSNESKNNFLKYYPELTKKTLVINNLINYKEIIEKSKEEKIIFSKTDIILLFVGRLEEESKRISIQINLIKDLIKDIPNLKLYIIGDGKDKNKYKNLIKNNNLEKNVIMLGSKTNPYPYIKECNYLILTSAYEGYPLVFTESIVLNKDIISTLSISDDIFKIGKNYGLVISNEYKKMLEELKEIITNKKSNKRKFDFESINKSRLTKLEELIKR